MSVINLLRRLGESRRELARRVLRERLLREAVDYVLDPRGVPRASGSEDDHWLGRCPRAGDHRRRRLIMRERHACAHWLES